jgi:hypothetical protein
MMKSAIEARIAIIANSSSRYDRFLLWTHVYDFRWVIARLRLIHDWAIDDDLRILKNQ